MERLTRRRLLFAAALAPLPISLPSQAQSAPAASAATVGSGALYAVEFKLGPRWDTAKPAQEQAFFHEHSVNLRALRERGVLVLGARYGDKGLIVLAAESEAAARAMVEQDPAVKHGTFSYELHRFSVFYGGAVQPAARQK